jgi:hypothetical protein
LFRTSEFIDAPKVSNLLAADRAQERHFPPIASDLSIT